VEPEQQKGIAMTPIAGFIIAIIAGWLVPSGRRAAAIVVIPYLAVAAAQTWLLAAGHGHSPPGTVTQLPGAIGYYLVQVAVLAVALGIAWLLGSLRADRQEQPDPPGRLRRQAATAFGLLAAATAVFITVGVLTSAPVHHHLASGRPPAIGFIGMALELLTVVALGAATIMRRRSAAMPDITPGGAPVTTTARQ
jgi:hypothetical protein